MELIAKVSKGSKMDQVYLPKNREMFKTGDYVKITPLNEKSLTEKRYEKPFFYGIKYLEPIKVYVANRIIKIIRNLYDERVNIIIAGSFLDQGFTFNDIDLLIIGDKKEALARIKKEIVRETGINAHIIQLNKEELKKGVETDPLYETLLSKCISEKRLLNKPNRKFNYKILDLYLLKSKLFGDNFDVLNGNEKYQFLRNLLAIKLFIENKKVSVESINDEIKKEFKTDIEDIKGNLLDKKDFLQRFNKLYTQTSNKIMDLAKHDSK